MDIKLTSPTWMIYIHMVSTMMRSTQSTRHGRSLRRGRRAMARAFSTGQRRRRCARAAFRWHMDLVMYRNTSITHEYLFSKTYISIYYNVVGSPLVNVFRGNKYIKKHIMPDITYVIILVSVNGIWRAV